MARVLRRTKGVYMKIMENNMDKNPELACYNGVMCSKRNTKVLKFHTMMKRKKRTFLKSHTNKITVLKTFNTLWTKCKSFFFTSKLSCLIFAELIWILLSASSSWYLHYFLSKANLKSFVIALFPTISLLVFSSNVYIVHWLAENNRITFWLGFEYSIQV